MVAQLDYEKMMDFIRMVKDRKKKYVYLQLNDDGTEFFEAKNLVAEGSNRSSHSDSNSQVNGRNVQTSNKNKYTEEECIQEFGQIKSKMDPKDCYYIISDFHYYNSKKEYRNRVCIFVYVPNSCNVIKRMTYSFAQQISPKDIEFQRLRKLNFDDFEDFTYEDVVSGLKT